MTSIGAGTANGERGLWLAIGVSLMLHAAVLSLHFGFPEASRALRDKALDVVLVNARSERKPSDAQVLAQANLDGGGSSDEERIAATPLPPSPREQAGDELEQAQQRVRALEAQQRLLLAQSAQSKKASPPPPETAPQPSPESAPPPPVDPTRNRLDLASRALEMARFEGMIARQSDEYNKRPRVKNLGTRAEEYRFARYVEDWRIKIEHVGTLNYPEAARGKLSGRLMLTVRIRNDGSVEHVEIDRPSGHRVLDDAARRIVRMAEPFAEFPPDIRREYDALEITRTWTFTSSNRLETGTR
ncbi:MAG: energy transducer TonB [Candidatus Accumulibacter sp.]|jgi:protein TonB|nr:energy transducer TonB [Accumulibacter sp.]